MSKKEYVYLEFEQLLNVLFLSGSNFNSRRWKQDPFSTAASRFLTDARALVPTRELRRFAIHSWMAKRDWENRALVRATLDELLKHNL
ncbi:MAG: hypothetical protein AAF483_26285 [Planctomycetota bacterium]